MARTVTGVDVGTRSSVFLRGQYKDNTFHVANFAFVPHNGPDVAAGWRATQLDFKPNQARVGLSGRDLNIRYTRVPRLPDWQLRKLMGFEVAEVGDQSGSEVASDFNVLPPLPEIEDEDVVLLGMAREALLDQHLAGLAQTGGRIEAFSPNPLALYNAWLRFGVIEEETTLVANIGHENLDVILVRGPDLLFARNLGGGSKLIDDGIAERFGIDADKAEDVKKRLVDLSPGATYRDANQEKASRSAQAATGQLASLLSSTVMFCKSQIKIANLRLDKVLLTGGGAELPGLTSYLSSALDVPVELFEAFRVVDTSKLDPALADVLETQRHACTIALGLATMASDPEAYSIEILPESLKRRREFWTGTALAIGAGLLAVAFVVFDAVRGSQALTAAQTELAQLKAQWARAERTHNETEQLLEESARKHELALDVHALAGSGEQLARTLTVLSEDLPELFWVTHLATEQRSVEHLGIARGNERPVVHVEGRAEEGSTTVAGEYAGFVQRLRQRLAEAQIGEALDLARNAFSLDLTVFSEPSAAADPAVSEDSAAAGGSDESQEG